METAAASDGSGSTPTGAPGRADAMLLAQQLEALRARQLALLANLRARNLADTEAVATAATAFAQVPEYAERLRRVQDDMQGLAARTADMRKRCAGLSGRYE